MRDPCDLSSVELVAIARHVQQSLYLDFDAQNRPVWNPHKSWDGADICDSLASLLADYGPVPDQALPIAVLRP